jgi:serine/threonine-protein kinase RsbW
VYTANTSAFYSKLSDLCDTERSAVALGFTNSNNSDETVWVAAEIESKLEAAQDIVEFWCDRLEMAAVSSGFTHFKIWLIAPEGFTPEAMATLQDRNAYGSSRKQVEILAEIINAKLDPEPASASSEYEIVIPMDENTEMIAAHTVEEITRRHGYSAKAINQIKTAIVEACINASEHGLSPDRRIYQKFAVDPDKITITVSNRGVRLADKPASQHVEDQGRRGWGLKLMAGLMDEVSFEDTDDGTRITMVKYIAANVA